MKKGYKLSSFSEKVFREGIEKGYRWAIAIASNGSFHDAVSWPIVKRIRKEKLRNKFWDITDWEKFQSVMKEYKRRCIERDIEIWSMSRKA